MGSTGGGVVCFVVLFARTLWKTYVEQKQRAYRNYAASCDASLSLNAIASAEMSCLILPRFCTWWIMDAKKITLSRSWGI